ncbi:MAG TPA: hypothetical protein VI756_11000 [Blastocatellia bacterium]
MATETLKRRARLFFAGLLIFLGLGFCLSRIHASHLHGNSNGWNQPSIFPALVLWAWERPEDLSFIDPRKVGVAFLAKTINLKGGEVGVRPRFQPLTVPSGTKVMPVVRIEIDRREAATLDQPQLETVASLISSEAESRPYSAIQIDFDAPKSARVFYRDLLIEVRHRLPAGFPVSMTALASWCIGDDWLSGLPVDEAVPMMFRMGADARPVLSHIEAGGDFHALPARSSLGISVDEPISKLPSNRRVYVFNPRPWSEADLKTVMSEVSQWQ